MEMANIFGVFSLLFLSCGLYGLYAFFKMKKDGHINETLLLGRNFVESQCKDKDEFIRKSSPAVLIFAIAGIGYGVIDLIHYYVKPMATVDNIAMAAFLIVIIGFMAYTSKLRKEYF